MRILPITINKQLIPQTMDGRKLRTRRFLNIQPIGEVKRIEKWSERDQRSSSRSVFFWLIGEDGKPFCEINCPWQVGDILYVREEHYAYGYWQDVEGEFTKTGKQKRAFHVYDRVGFPTPPKEYTFDLPENLGKLNENGTGWYKRLARFMPKRYARTFLEVTDVRIERLKDITEEEAILEGAIFTDFGLNQWGQTNPGWHILPVPDYEHCLHTARFALGNYWEKLNGPDSWDANPWVWVISFKLTKKPEFSFFQTPKP